MNKATAHYINQLLDESELFKSTSHSNNQKQTFDFSEETILITGAAGTIGSGLTSQLLNCNFKKLILVDNAESPFYFLINELELDTKVEVELLLTDIRDESSMQWLFETFKPTIVFHTAAYKHVPMMEAHPYEAVKLNVLATQLLADLSIQYKSKKFIFISTDKAVNPIAVMGMTKNIAEAYLKNLNSENSCTAFLIARFGNVLGSNGSILPLFIKQIEAEKPLTITNENVSRYFITKTKACQLILQIAAFNKFEHFVFTFNMGLPIKIIDLAHVVIDRYEKIHKKKSQTTITKLRLSEKLHEELVSKNETLEATEHDDVFFVVYKSNQSLQTINKEALKKITPYQNASEIKTILNSYILK